MVSAQEAGLVRFYLTAPSGARALQYAYRAAMIAPIGSPDAVQSTTATPEKLIFLPLGKDQGVGGYGIEVTFQGDATDGLDASDSVCAIPVMVNGNVQYLGNPGAAATLANPNFTIDSAFVDITATAATEVSLFKLRAQPGTVFRLGGERIFFSIEDDTA